MQPPHLLMFTRVLGQPKQGNLLLLVHNFVLGLDPEKHCIYLGTVINPKTHQNEITMLGVLANTSFSLDKAANKPFNQHFCMITKPQASNLN